MSQRQALTEEERNWLTAEPPVGADGQGVPWTLRDRSIRRQKWDSQVTHENLTLEKVDFESVQWIGPAFRNCTFRDIDFRTMFFQNARFENVLFERCSFDNLTIAHCHFTNCEHTQGSLRSYKAQGARFNKCRWSGIKGLNWDIKSCSFSNCSHQDMVLHFIRLSDCSLESCEFISGKIEGWESAFDSYKDVAFTKTALSMVSFQNSQMKQTVLSELAEADGISFHDLKASSLSFQRCQKLHNVKVVVGVVEDLKIHDCADLLFLILYKCRVHNLSFKNVSMFHTSLEGSEVDGIVVFENCDAYGIAFYQGRWRGLQLVDVRFKEYLTVVVVHFEKLAFSSVEFEKNIDLRHENVSYSDSPTSWEDSVGP